MLANDMYCIEKLEADKKLIAVAEDSIHQITNMNHWRSEDGTGIHEASAKSGIQPYYNVVSMGQLALLTRFQTSLNH
ncbi:hypothetical protein AB6F55_16335 [Providencia hangzhouensis]